MGEPSHYEPKRRDDVPPGTGTLGMVLFLLALGMLFGASMLGYVLLRFRTEGPGLGDVPLPPLLWASTFVIVLSSLTLHAAVQSVRLERQRRFRQMLGATFSLAIAFLLLQAPAMWQLLGAHQRHLAGEEQMPLFGLIFFLVLVHAGHVLGGLAPMAVVTWRGWRGRYDHEQHAGVRYLAMYWHFLDVVWVLMFAVFLVGA